MDWFGKDSETKKMNLDQMSGDSPDFFEEKML